MINLKDKPLLMIHNFKEKYLQLDLDNYILVFDDGLYNHYQTYKNIISKFPCVELLYCVSTGILDTSLDNESEQIDMESPDAHDMFFKTGTTKAFLSIDQIYEMNESSNVTFAVHGHGHLNLNDLYKYKRLGERFKIFQEDTKTMIETMKLFMRNDETIFKELIYCTPYNQYKDLEMGYLKKEFKKEFCKEVQIIGPNRIDIEEL